MKIAYWDIETWDLAAPFGPLLAASVLLLPEDKMVSFRQDRYVRGKKAEDMLDDRQLCCDLRDLLEKQHLHCGWYSKGFDIPHLQSRLALHGERLLRKMLHLDTIWYFKGWRGLKFGSAKMKVVARELGLKQKPEVPSSVWMQARVGKRAAMDIVVDRCEADVEITRQITNFALDNDLIRSIQSYP